MSELARGITSKIDFIHMYFLTDCVLGIPHIRFILKRSCTDFGCLTVILVAD